MSSELRSLIQVSDLSIDEIENIYFNSKCNTNRSNALKDRTVFMLFFENSTRTLVSFETAAKNLGAHTVNISVKDSSVAKGESITDMLENLIAIKPAIVIVRSSYSDFFSCLPMHILTKSRFINAGCGSFEHPTQAIIDYCVMRDIKGDLSKINILICGDILHSRVARSNIRLLSAAGANILISGPTNVQLDGVKEYFKVFENGIKHADVIMLLRVQKERMIKNCTSIKQYKDLYCLNNERISLMKKDAIILHPGPINRGIELCQNVNSERVMHIRQTMSSVPVRESIMTALL